MTAKAKYHSGFTLIEVWVTIAVFSVLVALAAPRFMPMMSSFRLKISSDTVKRQLMVAKVRAASNPNIHCGIRIDTSSYPHKVITFFDNDRNYLYTSSDTLYGHPIPLGTGIRYKSYTDSVVIFRGDGSIRTSFEAIISNFNNTKRDTIVVNPTGRIKVKRS